MKTDALVKQIDYDEPVMTNSPTYIKICEGNKVLYVFEYTDGTITYAIAEPAETGMDFTAIYDTDPQNGVYNSRDKLFNATPTTEAAVQAALDALVPIEIEMRPLSEYPLG